MSIAENYNIIKKELPSEIKLIAVSKTKTVEDIKKVYDVGCRDFGENKVQELLNKYDKLPEDIKWHLIGHLQTNKVKYLPNLVYLIHSLDSIKLLNEIEKQFSKCNKVADVLIQINIGKEEAKTGLNIEDLDELISEVEKCNFVKVKGLMATIPKGNEESCRYYFKKMKEIFDNLTNKEFKNISMEYLSIGMSGDYEYAIEEGSNMIRLGSKIFGKRNYDLNNN
ncbi:YggS family pyridoxal phosphate-dependent enzyme [Clostridium ihumii]|uniref:YggS family pyridoxal phosphate-dependent enzyme n=1 Tax=Clostridium ihumii TaxID=1470356 RepID=UPI00058F301B|nr:YggS family pyridoxal phosphate-dependent enzyme [Clostridium ihumii]